jgi:hypothetical protein
MKHPTGASANPIDPSNSNIFHRIKVAPAEFGELIGAFPADFPGSLKLIELADPINAIIVREYNIQESAALLPPSELVQIVDGGFG